MVNGGDYRAENSDGSAGGSVRLARGERNVVPYAERPARRERPAFQIDGQHDSARARVAKVEQRRYRGFVSKEAGRSRETTTNYSGVSAKGRGHNERSDCVSAEWVDAVGQWSKSVDSGSANLSRSNDRLNV